MRRAFRQSASRTSCTEKASLVRNTQRTRLTLGSLSGISFEDDLESAVPAFLKNVVALCDLRQG
jgi:hypothetical protein